SSGCASSSTRVASELSTRSICCANGRASVTRSCARRSRDAEIIFIAFVICRVDLTARTRRRISISEGIYLLRLLRVYRRGVVQWFPLLRGHRLARREELLRELLQRRIEIGLQLIVELLLLHDPRDDARVPRLERAIQLAFVGADFRDRDRVEVPVDAGVD